MSTDTSTIITPTVTETTATSTVTPTTAMTTQTLSPTLAAELWHAHGRAQRMLRAFALAAFGAVLLTLSSKVQIPFYPVPFTMQTFIVLVTAIVYGRSLAAGTLLLYLAAGAIGLPVFAGTPQQGAGLVYMFGPTGGYLAGFFIAAIACGALAEHGFARTFTSTLAVMLIGSAIIFVGGVGWLAAHIGWQNAIAGGVMPFMFSETLKIFLAALAVPAAWRLLPPQKLK